MRTVNRAKTYFTSDEYLAIERQAEYKSEYFNGEIFAMSGASRQHNLICVNVLAAFHRQLRNRDCEVYPGDMRVKVNKTGLYTYPDIIVVCGKPQFEDQQLDTLLNPSVIIEILSESTESYDRGKKFEHYRNINTLHDYILIAQDTHRIEYFLRQPDNRWIFSETGNLKDTICIDSIKCEIIIEDIYEKVEIPGEEHAQG